MQTGLTIVGLPPLAHGESVLFTQEGGFLEVGRLVAWAWRQRGDLLSGSGSMRFESLAPGSYAAFWNTSPRWVLALQACNGTFPVNAKWSSAPAGASAEVSLDLRPHQKALLEKAKKGR